jgi:hypothetical protein
MENQTTDLQKYRSEEQNLNRNLPTKLSDIKISGFEVVATTSQELCITKDDLQLSSLVVRKIETVSESVEVVVGRFIGKGIIEKPKTIDVNNSKLIIMIELMIGSVFEWFGKDLSSDHSKSLANKIYENYWWLKLSELKLFCERLKSGYWKQMHNMTPAVFMERLIDFAEDSMDIRESIGQSQSVEDKQNEKESFIPMSDEQKKEFSLFAQKLTEKSERKNRISEGISVGDMNAEIERVKLEQEKLKQ